MKELTLKNVKPAKRYAEAFFETMQENDFDKILSEFKLIVQIIEENEEFKNFLNHPCISNDEKKQLIKECSANFSDIIKNFLFVLIDENRINCLFEIQTFLIDKINKKNNVIETNVTLAFEPSDEIKQQISERLKKKLNADVYINFTVNPNIIGGLKIQIKDTVIDLSISKKIENFKKI